MKTYLVVFYSTLEDSEVQKECFGRKLKEGKEVTIEDFKRVSYAHGYDDLVWEPGSTVKGTLYEVTKKDFIKACDWEKARYVPIGVTLSDDTTAVAFQFRTEHRREAKHLLLHRGEA